MENQLDFKKDANDSIKSETAVKILLEKRHPWLKIEIVAWLHLKYDLKVIKGAWPFKDWDTIDVKENFNKNFSTIFLEAVNNWWNNQLKEEEYNIETTISNATVKSWWWSFAESMKDTNYIFFMDKEWMDKKQKWSRVAYLISREDIFLNNCEEAIKNGTKAVKWNKISKKDENHKWRSAYIITSLESYPNKIQYLF